MAVDFSEPPAVAGGSEPSRASLLRFWAPKYWPAWLLVGWLRGASLLPWRFALRLHKGIGSVLWCLLPRRRHIVERNIELAFPLLGRAQVRTLGRQQFANLAACIAETAFAWFGRVNESLADFEIEGDEHVYSALAAKRGVILYTGHFTPIEICGPVLKASFPLVGIMFNRRRNALLDEVQRRGRRFAAHVSFASDNVRAMIRALRNGAVVWHAPDQCYSSRSSIELQHFGEPVNVSTATSRLARASGASIIPFAYYRKPDDSGYVLRFEPPIEQKGDDEACTRQLLAVLERLIVQHPAQYAWTSNRLRNRRTVTSGREDASAPPTRALLTVLGVALFITLADNGAFFATVMESTESSENRWAIVVVMGLLVQTTVVLMLCLSAGTRMLKSIAVALLIIAAATGYFMSTYGIVVDPSMIRNLAETDVREASPLITLAALGHILVFGIVPAIVVWRIPLGRLGWRREAALKLGAGAGSVALLAVMVYLNYGLVTFFGHEHHELRLQVNPVYPLYSLARYVTRADDKPPVARIPLDAWRQTGVPPGAKPTLFVFVMGETARADRFSLNGYGKDTNPFTRKHQVVNFPHVSSCGTSTADSLPCIFSSLDRANFSHAKFAAEESLFQTLIRFGIDAMWLDNSTGCKHICDPDDFISLAGESEPELCHDNVCVDEILLRDFRSLIADSSRDHFIVLHQRGSHGPAYFTDTPQWAKVFLPECDLPSLQNCDSESINNAYDNTIRYTDYFLAEVIALLKGESDRYATGMLYVSDHGESLGEKGLYLHGLPYSIAPAEQIEVPMIFWGSSDFYQKESVDPGCLHRSSVTSTTHAAIFHSVLPLFGIVAAAYDEGSDILASCRLPEGIRRVPLSKPN